MRGDHLDILFKLATQEDTELVITLQNHAFFDDYKRFGVCPSYDRRYEQMLWIIKQNDITDTSTTKDYQYYDYIIYYNDFPVGNIIVKIRNQTECHISSLCIITQYRKLGIGTRAIQFIEEKFAYCDKITLDTPADKEENLIFYMKNGFDVVGEVKIFNVWCTLFEKKLNHGL